MLRAACLLALVAAPAAAQATGAAPAARFTLLLRDPAGKPVADADVALVVDAAGALPALSWFTARAHADTAALPALQPAARLALRSDAQGRVVAVAPASEGATASGWVATASGLGALVVALQAERPQRVALTPLAAIATTNGEPLRAHVRVRCATAAVTLPPLHGASVRLPAGDHDAWVRTPRGWLWRQLALVAGQSVTLADKGPVRRVRRPGADWQVLPVDRPDVALFDAGEDEVALHGEAAAADLVAWHAPSGRLAPAQTEPGAGGALLLVDGLAPPPDASARHEALALLQRTAGGNWLPLGIAAGRSAGADGRAGFLLPPPPGGDCWLVHVRTGRAPLAAPYRARSAASAGPAGDELLAVTVTDAAGAPVADVAVAYEPDGMLAAAATARTDDRGRAGLGRARTPGALRIVDERFGNQSIAVPAPTAAPLALVVDVGASLRGIARWPDGTPARGAVVTLRDPRGRLTPPTRTATTGDDGGFAFRGLADGGAYVVFVTAHREGRTWSGRAETTAGGEAPLALAVRDEDPEFAPPRR